MKLNRDFAAKFDGGDESLISSDKTEFPITQKSAPLKMFQALIFTSI